MFIFRIGGVNKYYLKLISEELGVQAHYLYLSVCTGSKVHWRQERALPCYNRARRLVGGFTPSRCSTDTFLFNEII